MERIGNQRFFLSGITTPENKNDGSIFLIEYLDDRVRKRFPNETGMTVSLPSRHCQTSIKHENP